jgi:hypothetical protein
LGVGAVNEVDGDGSEFELADDSEPKVAVILIGQPEGRK